MPWTVEDVDKHRQGLSPADKETWVTIANKVRATALEQGKSTEEADAAAVQAANAALKDKQQESLGGRIVNAFYEGAEPRVVEQAVATGLRKLMTMLEAASPLRVHGQALLAAFDEAGVVTGDLGAVLPIPGPADAPRGAFSVREGKLVWVGLDQEELRESGALIPFEGA